MSTPKVDRQWIVIATGIMLLIAYALIHSGLGGKDDGALVLGGVVAALAVCFAVWTWNG